MTFDVPVSFFGVGEEAAEGRIIHIPSFCFIETHDKIEESRKHIFEM